MPDRPRRQPAAAPLPAKTCAVCGRTMEWRKSWAKNWDDVKYCSDRCRASRSRLADPTSTDAALEATILRLLHARGAGKTICPSEAARALAGDDPNLWRPLMEPARQAARRLVASGQILITQSGVPVDPSTAKGAIRLRLR